MQVSGRLGLNNFRALHKKDIKSNYFNIIPEHLYPMLECNPMSIDERCAP